MKTEIHYDPDASTTVIAEDKEFVDEYLLLEGHERVRPSVCLSVYVCARVSICLSVCLSM